MKSEQGQVVIINHNAGSTRHGPNLRSFYSAKYLVKKGYQVHVFSGSYSHKYINLPEIKGEVTREDIEGINYYWVRTHKYKGIIRRLWSYYQFSSKLHRIVTSHVSEFKALICSSPPPVFIRVCYRLAKKFKARLIFDVRDIWPMAIIEMGTASKYNPYVMYMSRLERFAYRNSDGIASALPCAENYMRQKGMPDGNFYCIQNGTELTEKGVVNEQELPDDTLNVLKEKTKFRVGYCGAFDRDNDLDSFMGAAAILADRKIEFIFVGKGRARDSLVERAKKLKNVSVLTPVRSDQVSWVIEHFDLCFMGLRDKPINQYGVSMNKIFEYLRSARPIVSAISAGNDIVADAGCGISVKPENAQAVADAIIHFEEMSVSERNDMGNRGLDYLKKHHTYDVLVNEWIRAIEGK